MENIGDKIVIFGSGQFGYDALSFLETKALHAFVTIIHRLQEQRSMGNQLSLLKS